MKTYFVQSTDRRAAKYQIYDENGKHIGCSNKKEDVEGLQQAEINDAIITKLYDGNKDIGDITILGEIIEGAAVAAAKAFKN